jgi:hypothetical protein
LSIWFETIYAAAVNLPSDAAKFPYFLFPKKHEHFARVELFGFRAEEHCGRKLFR